MTRPLARALVGALLAAGLVAGAAAQTKKELVQKILQIQTGEMETVAKNVVLRPAEQMMQDAGMVIQRQVPADKRETIGRAIEAEVKKYVDEAYPLARERAIRLAPLTLGALLEERMTEAELKQLLAWFESPVNKKYQQLVPEMRNSFVSKLIADVKPLVDPKLQALDGRIRTVLGAPPAASGSAPAPAGTTSTTTRPAPPAAPASGK